MKIIITGSAGFIGYHLANRLLKNKKNRILGIDSINNYYSKKIKNLRINILKKNKNFIFKKINLRNKKKIDLIFKEFKPESVFHIAGQPGVLYSFKNPKSYKQNNVDATKVISLVAKKYEVKNFIFASSSSVYGDQKQFPIKENFKKKPKNYYAKTKLKCEELIGKTFLSSKTKYIIYRFFTIYGPFGRPDMFIHKFLNSIKYKKKIYLHNNGLNFRDFTYIDDLLKILIMTLKKMPHRKLLNICRSKPIKTTNLVKLINKIYGYNNDQIISTGLVKGEMLKTHGSNRLLKKNFKNLKFSKIELGLKKTISTFKKFGY